jgi:hypothetical protein
VGEKLFQTIIYVSFLLTSKRKNSNSNCRLTFWLYTTYPKERQRLRVCALDWCLHLYPFFAQKGPPIGGAPIKKWGSDSDRTEPRALQRPKRIQSCYAKYKSHFTLILFPCFPVIKYFNYFYMLYITIKTYWNFYK